LKLSNLLKAVTPISVIGMSAEGRAQNAENKNALPHTLLPAPEIGSIHYRAQDVKPGGLFVAISGHAADGHDFIDEALAKGASAVVTQKPVDKDSIIIVVKNSRKALAAISARFYGNPSEKLFMIGITGTNGKTTTSYLIESILSSAGFRVGVIGTINYRYSGKAFKNPVTTPESLDLQRILSEMLKDGPFSHRRLQPRCGCIYQSESGSS
jgi:UDP-N-acetylmuramoyl-L-alanyl-D-glutamate--2,6-diaminopimelate ligase